MAILTAFLALIAGTLLLQTASDAISLVRMLVRMARRRSSSIDRDLQRLLFLVPAHNEALLIETCVRSLLKLKYPPEWYRVVVIADNCNDGTAELARAAGAECLERHDPDHRGKPHAIAWALGRLPVAEYDAVVIVDADTTVDAEFATEVAAVGPLRSKAVQAFFDLSNPGESLITRMAAVLATGTHRFAYPLKQRAGLNVPLVGNGMVIGTQVLARYGWHAFSICEDSEMYALLTEHGVSIECAPRARVRAQEARSLSQSSTQRQRWTAGRLTVLARLGARLIRNRHFGYHQKLDVIAEFVTPGPALHLGLVTMLCLVSMTLHLPGAGFLVGALAASLLRPAALTIAALAVHPTPVRAVLSFAFLPVYALWRIGAAVRSLRMVGNSRWIRTQRHRPEGV